MTGRGTGRKKSIVSHIEHIRFLSTVYLYSMENALKIRREDFYYNKMEQQLLSFTAQNYY